MNQTKTKRKKKLLRWVLLILLVYICVWSGINGILNIPSIRSYILSYVQESSGIAIKEAGWVYIGPTGNLSISSVNISIPLLNEMTELSIGTLTFKYVGYQNPYLQVKQLITPWGSVRQSDIHIIGDLTNPHFSISINQANLDFEALIALSAAQSDETTSTENSTNETNNDSSSNTVNQNTAIDNPLESLQITASTIHIPWLQNPINFDLGFQQLDGSKADGRVTVYSSAEQAGNLRTAINWLEFPTNISTIKGRFDSFSWNEPITAFQGILNGSFDISQKEDGDFSYSLAKSIHNASYTQQWHSPNITLNSKGMLDASFFPTSVSATIQHEEIQNHDIGVSTPNGIIAIDLIHHSSTEQQVSVQFDNSILGSVQSSAKGNIFSPASSFDANFSLKNIDLNSWLNHLPNFYQIPDLSINGTVSATSTLQVHENDLQGFQLNINAPKLNVDYPGISIKNTGLSGTSTGNLLTQNALLAITPGELTVTSLDPPLTVPLENFSVDITNASNRFEIKSAQINGDWWDQLALTYNSDYEYQADVSTTVDKILPTIFANFIPGITRAFEGTGEIAFQLNGSPDGVNVQAKSEDVALFSFDEEPFIGAQLRNINTEYVLQDWTTTSASIQAATPYFLYGDIEIDLPGNDFSVTATGDESYNFIIDASLPHDGTLHTDYKQNGDYKLQWQSIDLQTGVIPVLSKYLQTDLNILSTANGITNGWMQSSTEDIKGEVDIVFNEWRYDAPPSVGIQNATLSVPFAYPLEISRFPKNRIQFQTETAMWQDTFYSSINTELIMSDESIQLPETLNLPLFGGEFFADQLTFLDWKSGYPTIVGEIKITEMDMKQANAVIPYLGNEGTLSLDANEIIYRGDRFSLQGSVAWNAFSGSIAIQDVFYQPEKSRFGLSMYLQDVNLEQLTKFLNYGKLTGKLNGHIKDLLIQFPKSGENGIPKPVAFDLELMSKEKKEQIISGSTLKKLMDLGGGTTVPFQQELYSREFKYAGLGLRGIHSATQTQIYGTLKDNYFIAPSSGIFSDKVGIRMQVAENETQSRNVDFKRLWETLLDQMGY